MEPHTNHKEHKDDEETSVVLHQTKPPRSVIHIFQHLRRKGIGVASRKTAVGQR